LSTLKEAIESGRRWRHKDWRPGLWAFGHRWVEKDGTVSASYASLKIESFQALSSDFEIEPEIEPKPEKPREWMLHVNRTTLEGHALRHQPFPCHSGCATSNLIVRVHDADACDRLHKNCDVPR
jgi:hypothetical protein